MISHRLAIELVKKRLRVVDSIESLENSGRVNTDSSTLPVIVRKIPCQRLDIIVEVDADEFPRFIYNRTAAAAPDVSAVVTKLNLVCETNRF